MLGRLWRAPEAGKWPVNSGPYDRHPALGCSYPVPGILEIVLEGPGLNSIDAEMHRDLATIWTTIDEDPAASVVVVRGAGKGFSAGGQYGLLESMMHSYESRTRVMREARQLVYNMVDCSKPVIAAVHGPVIGAGLAVAVLADICIASRSAVILDGHTRLGVAAGDHAVISWPILVGLAKAKYYLLTNDVLTGEEAARIGLVARAVEEADVVATAMTVARRILEQSADATRWTKQTLNHWLRAMAPAFDASLALEFYGFGGPDPVEGLAALRDNRSPGFGEPAEGDASGRRA
jgi:enoyl-CoA hydratase